MRLNAGIDVPVGWQFVPLKRITRFGYGDALASDHREQGGVKVYGSNGPFDEHSEANTQAPCIVVGRKGSYGKLNYSTEPVFAVDTTFVVDQRHTNADLRFLYYLLGVLGLDELSDDTAVPGLSREKAYQALSPLPPLDTQQRIARFLDEKTGRIDGLIDKKRALLDRLAEKRQALITRAVTKGLDPTASMKPSGIDWLGETPNHWQVLPLRRVSERVATGRTPPSTNADYFTDGELNWFTPGDFSTGIEIHNSARKIIPDAIEDGVCSLFPSGTVFLVGIGATLGKVAVSAVLGSANQQINAILPNKGVDPYFVAYFLHGFRNEVRVTSNGNTLGILNQEGTKSLLITVPPPSEQMDIANHLRSYDVKAFKVIRLIEESIEHLAENRAAIITAAVTGQIPELQ